MNAMNAIEKALSNAIEKVLKYLNWNDMLITDPIGGSANFTPKAM